MKALDFALDLADRYSAKVSIINVSQSLGAMGTVPSDPSDSTTENLTSFARDITKIHEEILNKAIDHAKHVKPNLAVLPLLRQGDPAMEIINAVNEGHFDVVVVGHRGQEKGRMKELVLGKTSEKVAHTASCPVVIVK